MMRANPAPWLVLLLIGCVDGSRQAHVELLTAPVSGDAPPAAAAIESGRAEVMVRHSLDLPDGCGSLSADLVEGSPREYVLRIFAHTNGEGCEPGQDRIGYVAVLRDLPVGRSRLRVVHIVASRAPTARTVLEHMVLVSR